MAARDDLPQRAILWDLDGTLADTEELHAVAERSVLGSLGVADELIEAAMSSPDRLGQTTRRVLLGALERAGLSHRIDEAMELFQARAAVEVIGRAQPKPGVNRLLLDIPMREVRFALVTSSRRDTAEALLERFAWTWRFELITSVDDVARPKPDPEPYRVTCERLGISPSSALAVEDSPLGIQSARAAGVRVAAVVGTFPADELRGANWIISDVGAVPSLLRLIERDLAAKGRET